MSKHSSAAVQGPRAFLGLEPPEDPAQWAAPTSPLRRCPSLWVFPELMYFDQGHFGHPRKKPTSFLTTSWVAYEELAAHRCSMTRQSHPPDIASQWENHHLSHAPGRYASAAWARWAPGFVGVLKDATPRADQFLFPTENKLFCMSKTIRAFMTFDLRSQFSHMSLLHMSCFTKPCSVHGSSGW